MDEKSDGNTELGLADKLKELLAEANRRRVFRTAGLYLVAVWGVSTGSVDLAGLFGIPVEWLRISVFGAIALLPVVVILAWMFDIGRDGIVRDPQDAVPEQSSEDALADMPTIIGEDLSSGAVVVRWKDGEAESAKLYVDEFFLGRGTDCRVRFYDPLISRRHARVYHENGIWYIEDLGSRNGTQVDEQRIERLALAVTNQIRLNDTGPPLQLDLVAAGAEMRSALASYPSDQATAHVRISAADLETSNQAANRTK
jgi:pSer/pThr/pTyr-binding forkhead associated (FHA) protein